MGCAKEIACWTARNENVRGEKMKLNPELKNMITQYANLNGVPPEIIYGIVCAESGGDPKATRYEPAYYEKYIVPRKLHESEAKSQATSWGLMQEMGSNLRDMGYKESFFEFLNSSDLQLDYGVRFFKKLWNRYFNKWGAAGVIAAYNAGSPRIKKDGKFVNQGYVDKSMKFSREY